MTPQTIEAIRSILQAKLAVLTMDAREADEALAHANSITATIGAVGRREKQWLAGVKTYSKERRAHKKRVEKALEEFNATYPKGNET